MNRDTLTQANAIIKQIDELQRSADARGNRLRISLNGANETILSEYLNEFSTQVETNWEEFLNNKIDSLNQKLNSL